MIIYEWEIKHRQQELLKQVEQEYQYSFTNDGGFFAFLKSVFRSPVENVATAKVSVSENRGKFKKVS